MNRTLLGLVAALAVALGALYLLDARDRRDDPAATTSPDRALAYPVREDIARIVIADLSHAPLTLDRRADGAWLLNDSLPASQSIVDQLLSALTRMRIDHIPPDAAVGWIVEEARATGINVRTFDAAGEPLRSIIIGPATSDERNSYVLAEGSGRPYAVRTPGLTGSLRPLFDLRSVNAFRARDFVKLDPNTLGGVRVDYPRQPGESFAMSRGAGGQLSLKPANALVEERTGANPRLLESYLEGFAYVPLFRYADDARGRDSIVRSVPHARIAVALGDRADGPADSTVFELHPNFMRDDDGLPLVEVAVPTYYVLRDGSELAVVQTKFLQNWLRGYSSFF